MHFQTYAEAEAYSAKFRPGTILDRDGQLVIYSHKGRVDARPPQVRRRGAALAPIHDQLRVVLAPGEKLELAHEAKLVTYSLFFAVNGGTQTVREVARAYWHDDGDQCMVTKIDTFADFVPDEVWQKAMAAIGS